MFYCRSSSSGIINRYGRALAPILNAFYFLGRDATDNGLWGNVLGDDGTGSNDGVVADVDTREDDGIGSNPYVVANDHGAGADALLVDALGGIVEVVVEGCDSDALCQIDVAADGDGPDDGAMDADAGMVADEDIAHGVVDAAEGLDDATLAEAELSVGRGVHSHAAVYLGATAAMLVEWCQKADVPTGTCIALVHDEVVEELLEFRTVAKAISYFCSVAHNIISFH